MATGREILARMEGAISSIRANETQLDASLRSAEAEAARLRQQRIDSFKALAEIKIDLMRRGEFVGELDAAERRASALLAEHESKLAGLAGKIADAAKAIEAAEGRRHERAETLENAVEAYDRFVAEIGGRLRHEPRWTGQQEKVAAAARVAEEADKKAQVAEADLSEKRKPYESDPLFMYLWKRQFGTGAYSAGHLARYVDRLIADFIGYLGARGNFHMLNEIPRRLRGHADKAAADAKAEAAGLATIEAEAQDAAGGKPLADAVAKGRAALEAAERELAGKRAVLATLEKQRDAARDNAGDDSYRRAVELVAEADSRLDLRSLQAEAMRTATPNDEAVVGRIRQTDEAILRVETEVTRIREEMRSIAQRRAEIERVRDESRRRGYDNPFGTFDNSSIIGDIIGGVLKGALQGAILDKVLRDGYRERSHHWEPDFGNRGGGLNFPKWGQGSSGSGGIFTQSDGNSGWSGGWSDWIGGGGGSDGGGGGDSGGGGGDFSSGDSF
jgi:chromosome segregation ATPase